MVETHCDFLRRSRVGFPLTYNTTRVTSNIILNKEFQVHHCELFTGTMEGYCLYRIPALVVTQSDTVLAFCEARRYTGRDDDVIDILLRRSFDGGRTWDRRQTVISDGDRTCGNPCPLVDRETGVIMLPFCKDNQQVFLSRSDNDGQTWSDPLRLRAPGVCPQLLLLDNGVLVCSYGTRRNVHVMASLDDQGREWSKPLVLYEGQTSGYTNLQSLAGDRFRVVHQEGSFDAHQPGGSRFVRTELLAKPGVISDAG